MQRGTLGSFREWALLLGSCLVVAAGATILWAVGYEFFWSIPYTVTGIMLGLSLGYMLIRVFGRGWRAFITLFLGWVLVALMYFMLPYEWIFADSGFMEESDETWMYWLWQGAFFGFAGSAALLASSLSQEDATPAEIRKRRRDSGRSLMVLGGTVVGVFTLLFFIYVFLEYLLAPIVRFLN